MLQVIQNAQTRKLTVSRVPLPLVQPGEVLIRNVCSAISAGTEKMVIDLAGKSLLGKARERPDRVREVIQKVRKQGLFATWRQVSQKLGEPIALGYASAGVVLACGEGVQNLRPGDRVASNGWHAGIVAVPKNLCAIVPDGVPFEQAAFTTISSIALQGVRLAKLGLGDTVLVIGLGLIGQIAVKLLKLQGARVFGTDLDPAKCKLAIQMGADEAIPGLTGEAIAAKTRGVGVDAVLITAATKSDGPVHLAADAVRQRGRVVVVGAVGLNLQRQPFYLKEAELQVSCSYGPGRYDADYEIRGNDYPVGHVRWTEQRNMQSILDLMGTKQLDLSPLISHRYSVEKADEAYELIHTGSEPYLGIVLQYPGEEIATAKEPLVWKSAPTPGTVGVGFLGAGGFARHSLIPSAKKIPNFELQAVCAGKGIGVATSKDHLGFSKLVSDEDEIFSDPAIKVVFIATRHDQHANQVMKALRAGKHVFVEKPLAITIDELASIEETLADLGENSPSMMVGFNRRFAPATAAVKKFFSTVTAPLSVSIRFNAGHIPAEHWTQDETVGGGRIIGEACHAIDLAAHLVGSPVTRVFAESVSGARAPQITHDQCFITLRHANGSISNVAYLASGDKACPKERIEIFGGGRTAMIDDFCRVEGWSNGKCQTLWQGTQDKGHQEAVRAFSVALAKGGSWAIPYEDLMATSLASVLAVRSIREGIAFEVEGNIDSEQQIVHQKVG